MTATARRGVAHRLPPWPGEVIDRSRPVAFTWNGEPIAAYAGDTIVSALVAAGHRVFSRSLKYHRPRGVLCASYLDPGCTVQVDDEPNVRGAHRRVSDGMAVSAQNVWPSLRLDVRAANQAGSRFLTAGFYYKTFMRPRALWPAYEKVLQRFAAGGRIGPDPQPAAFEKRHAHPDVLVAGAGPAGMAAAVAAADAGAQVMLVEEEHHLGGHLRWGDGHDLAVLSELRAAVAARPAIEVLTDSVVTGRYEDNWCAVVQRGDPDVFERLIKARTRCLVVAAGLVERPYVFAGNDRPGVMLSTGVRRLLNLYAVRPGQRAVVLSANPEGDAAVEDLERAGIEVVRVLDARAGEDLDHTLGRHAVTGVVTAAGATLRCDLLVTAVGWTAPTSLLNMAGDRPVYRADAARFVPGGGLRADVLVAGGLAGDGTVEELVAHGAAIGTSAARGGSPLGAARPRLALRPHPELFRSGTHGFVDLCEDVTSEDIVAAAAEGYDSVELVKRFTTVTMGPTQGKLETVNAVAVLAEATGRTIAETGTTVWRPPYSPITLGALAGRQHEPVRRSPMQEWHEAQGAAPLVAGQWIRPDHYGDPAGEAANVRRRVGIIDVTPLGKLDLRGPDVTKLLNLAYTNRWSKLAVGAVRYGVMCGDDGVVLDDGVTGRLGDDHYLMSTTSTGAAVVGEWLERLLQVEHPHWIVHIVPMTTAYASINVAGPRSRELLARLADDVDLSAGAFAYMQVRRAVLAAVRDCVMWRIGFTGELSYELHVPAGYGLHVWEELLAAGADLGVRPFGVEAQRILRLEKGHFIVGQDTDGLTTALSLGIDRLLAIDDKDDFIGLPELRWQREAGGHPRLVALRTLAPAVVAPEASQLVAGHGRIVGRVTSSRMSPTLGRSICLALVLPEHAAAGTGVTVLLPDGRRVPARVMAHHAAVDPEGTRQRG